MTNQNDCNEDKLSFSDLHRALKIYWRSVIIFPFVFTIITLLFTKIFVSPCFEAEGLIDIGKVSGILLEDSNVVVDRLNQSSFIDRVVEEHVNLFRDQHEVVNKNKLKFIVVRKNKESNLLSFSLLASNRVSAKLKADAMIETLANIHQKIYVEKIKLVKREIFLIDNQINKLKDQGFPNISLKNANDTILMLVIANDRRNQLNALMNSRFEMESNLSPTQTYNTRLLDRVYVSEDPISPNLILVTLISFLIGIFGSILAALVRYFLKG